MSTDQGTGARKQHGLTLIELVMFILIVSIAVVGVLQVLTLSTRYSADPQARKQALSIAEGLLEEVELAHFTYCDPSDAAAATATSPASCTTPEVVGQETGNSRPFDNVNDYVTAFGTPVAYTADANGGAIGVGGYTATITITPDSNLGSPAIASGAASGSMEVLRITVTVTYSGGTVTLDGYRTRYAPTSLP